MGRSVIIQRLTCSAQIAGNPPEVSPARTGCYGKTCLLLLLVVVVVVLHMYIYIYIDATVKLLHVGWSYVSGVHKGGFRRGGFSN